MKEILKTFISLIVLLTISILVYLTWIINKGEFKSKYLEEFINNKFKTENFYTSIEDPVIKFDKNKKTIIIDGKNFSVFSLDKNKVLEFQNLKIHINFIPLITKRKLIANKIEMLEGKINFPTVFVEPLKINYINLDGYINANQKEINLSNFSVSIKEDFYEGTVKIDTNNIIATGNLTKLNRKKVFYGLDLSSEDLDFKANKNQLFIEGKALFGGVNVYFKGNKKYKDKSKYISKYSLSGNIDEKQMEKVFNLETTPFLEGPIKFNATYFIYNGSKKQIKTSSNLKESKLNFPFLGLTKNEGIEATADIDFNFTKENF